MIMKYIKITFRNLRRYMRFSLTNMIGLATGMTAFLLILMYVSFKSSYDKYHAQVNQVCQLNLDISKHAGHTCCISKPPKKLEERKKKLAVCSSS